MRLAPTYDPGPDEVDHRTVIGRNYMEVLGGAGAWVATPSDLVTILDSLDLTKPGWKPLDEATLDVMQTSINDPLVPDRGYGLGLILYGGGAYGHTGTVESTHAMMLDRNDGVSWALTVSGEYPSDTSQLAGIVDDALVVGGFVPWAPPATGLTVSTSCPCTRVPLTVIGGYLGAGKTTLVNQLLREPDGRRIGVIVNDFGSIGIDVRLLAASPAAGATDVISLPNGCVCCTIGGGLQDALARLADLEPTPDHVVVEASGVADPASRGSVGDGAAVRTGWRDRAGCCRLGPLAGTGSIRR